MFPIPAKSAFSVLSAPLPALLTGTFAPLLTALLPGAFAPLPGTVTPLTALLTVAPLCALPLALTVAPLSVPFTPLALRKFSVAPWRVLIPLASGFVLILLPSGLPLTALFSVPAPLEARLRGLPVSLPSLRVTVSVAPLVFAFTLAVLLLLTRNRHCSRQAFIILLIGCFRRVRAARFFPGLVLRRLGAPLVPLGLIKLQ
jgi:hypothetical protein